MFDGLYIPPINIPPGGKPRQRFEGFLKKCRFRHSETTDSCPKIGSNFPGILEYVLNDNL